MKEHFLPPYSISPVDHESPAMKFVALGYESDMSDLDNRILAQFANTKSAHNIVGQQERRYGELGLKVAELEDQLDHDALCQDLLSKTAFKSYAKKALETIFSEHEDPGHPHVATIVFLDIVGFGEFNDKYGHVKADEVLKDAGKAISSHKRSYDLASRFGGDEFFLLLPYVDPEDEENSSLFANNMETLIKRIENALPEGLMFHSNWSTVKNIEEFEPALERAGNINKKKSADKK